MGRPSNTAARRAEIAEAFLAVVADRGYEGATTAAVAAAAGLAPGLVHYHFASKEDVLVAALERLAARVAARAEGRLARAGADPRRRLAAFLDAHVALGPGADRRAVAAWVAIGAEAPRRPEVRRAYEAAVAARLRALEDLLRACLRAAGRSPRPARAWAAALAAALEGAFHLGIAAPGALPAGFAAPALRRVLDGLLDPP